ncbi:MAG: tRNA epoxyqueuosine(34) reductase QueG [Bdellovibrionota bacterium]
MNLFEQIDAKFKIFCEEDNLKYIGLVSLQSEPDYRRFNDWLAAGKHAGMGYLENHSHCREDPRNLHPEVKSALVVALNYNQGDKRFTGKAFPRVAQYARIRDYHKILKKRLISVLEKLKVDMDLSFNYRVITDSAPIMERALAARIGKGFIGKNTCYIDSQEGSWLLLAEALLTLKFEIPKRSVVLQNKRTSQGGCGSCTRCQIYCPTGALSQDYQLDARKCFAYYSIEHRGVIPEEFWHVFKYYWFGCDICQLVCPYNRKASIESSLPFRIDDGIDLFEVAIMDQIFYEKTFGGSPMTRAKKEGLQRNALISLFVNADKRLGKAIELIKPNATDVLYATIEQIETRLSVGQMP